MDKTSFRLSTTTREDLITHYVAMMESDNATIFAGAGLSINSGMPTWNKLMDIPMKALGLDPGKNTEPDYYDIAEKYVQYYASRTVLTNLLVKEISNHLQPSENHRVLTRLPFSRIWTSNFDLLLEEAYKTSGKKHTVIRRDMDFTFSNTQDVKIYKIHGCITLPESMVITKQDVQLYDRNFEILSKAFLTALAEDMFLFIGFSFKDPHFETVMGILRSRYLSNTSQHFAVMKRPDNDDEIHTYSLTINNLQRYGILTLVVDDYSEISLLLKDIEKAYIRRNIFLSGSFDRHFHKNYVSEPVKYDYDNECIHVPYIKNNEGPNSAGADLENNSFYMREIKGKVKKSLGKLFPYNDEHRVLEKVLEKIGKRLYEKEMNIYTGFGLGICDGIVEGFSKMFKEVKEYRGLMDRLKIFPLPLKRKVGAFHDNFYRENLLGSCGIMIITRGSTYNSDYTSGTFEEYYIAKGLSDLLMGRQKQVHQSFSKQMAAISSEKPFREKEFSDGISQCLSTQKGLISYQYQEITEMFYRTLYEQWKLVIRLMDGYIRRLIIILEKKLPALKGKVKFTKTDIGIIDQIKLKWSDIRRNMQACVLSRSIKFYSLFETEPVDLTHHKFEETDIDDLIKKLLLLRDDLKKLSGHNNETIQKARIHCDAVIRLIQGDYKYLVIAEMLEAYTQTEIDLTIQSSQIAYSKNNNSEQLNSQKANETAHLNNFCELWEKLIVYKNKCEQAFRKEESYAENKKWYFRDKKEYILKEQFDYLFFDDGIKKWKSAFNANDELNIPNIDKLKFSQYVFNVFYNYNKDKQFDPAQSNKNIEENFGVRFNEASNKFDFTASTDENKGAGPGSTGYQNENQGADDLYDLPDNVFYKIQTYKILLVLSDVIGGLQRVTADYETILISTRKNNNKNLRNSIYLLPKEEEDGDMASERKMDPFFYDPNKFHEILALHKEYIKHYQNHVDFLLNMMKVNRHVKSLLANYQSELLANEKLKVTEGMIVLKSEYVRRVKSLVDRTMNNVYQHKQQWEIYKEKYMGIPLRPATVIIPIACLGGMARKIWQEERIRFDYLCSFRQNFDETTRHELLYHYDNLRRIDFLGGKDGMQRIEKKNITDIAEKSSNKSREKLQEEKRKDGEEKDIQKINNLLESVFFIIDKFRQPPKVGATKPL